MKGGKVSGTLAGGRKARDTNYKLHGKDFYKRIGAIGGRNGHSGGFAANPELARMAGRKGGRISRRGPAKDDIDKIEEELEQEYGRNR